MSVAYCHQCGRDTESIAVPLSSGHIGNCCAVCRATRKGKPFLARHEVKELRAVKPPMPAKGRGCRDDATS